MQKLSSPKTYYYKACPRCRGDLILNAEEESMQGLGDRLDGMEYVCLQCGRRWLLSTASVIRAPVATSTAA
jgi:DNA-directed RNA polymerase subunit RPC12/RpoP